MFEEVEVFMISSDRIGADGQPLNMIYGWHHVYTQVFYVILLRFVVCDRVALKCEIGFGIEASSALQTACLNVSNQK